MAALIVFPLVTVLADFVGLLGGMIVVVFDRDVDPYLYWNTIAYWVVIRDFLTGLVKSLVFGIIVTLDRLLQRARHRGRDGGAGPRHHRHRGAGGDGRDHLRLLPDQAPHHPVLVMAARHAGRGARGVEGLRREGRSCAGINLSLDKGTTLAVMGGSGSGKTVLLRTIDGLLAPDAGEVWLLGTRIDGLREEQILPVRRRTGLRVPGRGALRLAVRVRERGLPAARAHQARRGRDHRSRAPLPRAGRPARHRRRPARASCRGGCASAWGSRGRWSWSRRSCSSTSPPRASTRPTRGWWRS